MLLSIAIFILFAFPRMSVKIGPVPLYAIDFFLFASYVYTSRLGSFSIRENTIGRLLAAILFFAIISEFFVIIDQQSVFQPIYMMVRTLLAMSLFVSVSRYVQVQEDLYALLKPALFGALITAIIVVISSIPPTRQFVKQYVFTIKFLEPASEGVIETYQDFTGAVRGRSYVGVSILSGAFLNCIWPLLLYLRSRNFAGTFLGIIVQVVSVLIPIAVIMTYSRGAIIGTAFVILGILVLNAARFRSNLLVLMGIGLGVMVYIGLDSDYFYFRRLERSTERVINQPIENRNETERLYAYVEPFTHMANRPRQLFFGNGLSRAKVDKEQNRYWINDANFADHAVFGKAYITYGMIAAFLYIIILFVGIQRSWYYSMKHNNPYGYQFSRVLFASILGFLPWFVFGHAAVSTPRGAMLFYFLFALIAMQGKIKPSALKES